MADIIQNIILGAILFVLVNIDSNIVRIDRKNKK